jgi:hypothetical protein
MQHAHTTYPSRKLTPFLSLPAAAHLCSTLLINGHKVRGTVRSTEKGEYLKKLFDGVGEFEYVIVEDIADVRFVVSTTCGKADDSSFFILGSLVVLPFLARLASTPQPNAFDEAVKGVQGIAHTASPFYLDAKTHDELLKPAIEGTVNVMRSALKNEYVRDGIGRGSIADRLVFLFIATFLLSLSSIPFSLASLAHSPHLQRLVITSSVAAVVDPNPRGEQHANGPPYTMDERDWNEYSPKVVEEKGVDAPGSDKYRASKVSPWSQRSGKRR